MVGFHGSDDGIFAAFTNVWMLLNYLRQINSSWPLQIMADATFKFCNKDIALIGMGCMTPGGRLEPLIYAYAPSESSEAYRSAWCSYEKSRPGTMIKRRRFFLMSADQQRYSPISYGSEARPRV